MPIIMVKKRMSCGNACKKCDHAEELLRARGLWQDIDQVIWADVSDPNGEGMRLAKAHEVELAPFFIIENQGQPSELFTSTIRFIKRLQAIKFSPENYNNNHVVPQPSEAEHNTSAAPPALTERRDNISDVQRALQQAPPPVIVRWALEQFGAELGIAFSGAEDVALIHMASQTALPFRVFCLDTGRLHPETYGFIEQVRSRYGVHIELCFPEREDVEALTREKGLFSFYTDGHQECCAIRKVQPLTRTLRGLSAWMTGQRRDQSPTRSDLSVFSEDTNFSGKNSQLFKLNPLAHWSQAEVWNYLRQNQVPYNPLHDQGFISIGCEPCTRRARPGEHERAGRWWWEESTQRECGLHVKH